MINAEGNPLFEKSRFPSALPSGKNFP